jgi:hypothetical protein
MSESENAATIRRVATALRNWSLNDYEALLADQAVEGRPQIKERFVGRENIMGMYRSFPGQLEFSWRGVRGAGAVWVLEGIMRYGENLEYVIGVFELVDGKIFKVDWYFAPPVDPPPYHARWAERTEG